MININIKNYNNIKTLKIKNNENISYFKIQRNRDRDRDKDRECGGREIFLEMELWEEYSLIVLYFKR